MFVAKIFLTFEKKRPRKTGQRSVFENALPFDFTKSGEPFGVRRGGFGGGISAVTGLIRQSGAVIFWDKWGFTGMPVGKLATEMHKVGKK